MKSIGRISYFLTDRRRRITLVVALVLTLPVVSVQYAMTRGEDVFPARVATVSIAAGTPIGEANTRIVSLSEKDFNPTDYYLGLEGRVARKTIESGGLILKTDAVQMEEILPEGPLTRRVTLKLDLEMADAWQAQIGDLVELVHWDPQRLAPLVIFEGVRVVRFLRVNPKDDYPSYVVLSVDAAQRDYVLSHRGQGRFEISQ